MNLAARAGRWSARHRKAAILGWLDRLGHRRRGSPDAPDAGIVYDMRVGVVGQIAAGAEVTGRVLEVLESARRAGIRVFFTRHCCCRTRPPVRPRWSARRFVAIGASHA